MNKFFVSNSWSLMLIAFAKRCAVVLIVNNRTGIFYRWRWKRLFLDNYLKGNIVNTDYKFLLKR